MQMRKAMFGWLSAIDRTGRHFAQEWSSEGTKEKIAVDVFIARFNLFMVPCRLVYSHLGRQGTLGDMALIGSRFKSIFAYMFPFAQRRGAGN